MNNSDIQVWRTNRPRDFLLNGKTVTVPDDWEFVPSGDPGLTRRLKSTAECWCVVYKRKRRIEAIGLWCDREVIRRVKNDLEEERSNPVYLRKLEAARLARIAMLRGEREKAEGFLARAHKLFPKNPDYLPENFFADFQK